MDKITAAFISWLRTTRINQGLSQYELEKRAGFTKGTVARLENLRPSITIQTMEKFTRTLGKNFDDIILEGALGLDMDIPAINQRPVVAQDAQTLEGLQAIQISRAEQGNSCIYPRDTTNDLIEAVYSSGGALFGQDFSTYLRNARHQKGLNLNSVERLSKISQTTLRRYEEVFPNKTRAASILGIDLALQCSGSLFAIAWRAAEFYNVMGLYNERTQVAENLLKQHRMQAMQVIRTKQKQEIAGTQNKTSPDSLDLFLDWIDIQLEIRNWSYHRLAKNAGLDTAAIRKARKKERKFSWEACAKMAAALGFPPEYVFRKAGLLPDNNPIAGELCTILSTMEEADQRRVLDYARSLSPRTR